ncbi:cell division protein Fic [Bombiscardovia nodaiensis]|uniref:Cell division protein Fic n=1 Tax=Bombiscardovia nodaiensis TaxID=2932181 RepID=A0ABN6SE87_9BIFI|nr:cell division protein Fic [Bombiscardovia nodaiensis]
MHARLARRRLEADSAFRTGIVTGLGELFTALPRFLSLQLQGVELAERRLALMWAAMPGVAREEYCQRAISGELLATNAIEGVSSTRQETDLAVRSARESQGGQGKSAQGKSVRGKLARGKQVRFGETARLYWALSQGEVDVPRSLLDIRRMYDAVVGGEIAPADQPDGELFRSHDVSIQGPRGSEHRGVSGELRIGQALTQMMDMVANPGIPGLLAALMAHFVFEYVHPFYDGNGRTGRYLLALYLADDLTLPTVLSLSRAIADHKSEYDKAFRQAENKLNCGELTFFVSTILGFISQAQAELMARFEEQEGQQSKAQEACQQAKAQTNLSKPAASLLEALMEEHVLGTQEGMTLDAAAQRLDLGKQSARAYMSQLVDAGLAQYATRRPLSLTVSPTLAHQVEEA